MSNVIIREAVEATIIHQSYTNIGHGFNCIDGLALYFNDPLFDFRDIISIIVNSTYDQINIIPGDALHMMKKIDGQSSLRVGLIQTDQCGVSIVRKPTHRRHKIRTYKTVLMTLKRFVDDNCISHIMRFLVFDDLIFDIECTIVCNAYIYSEPEPTNKCRFEKSDLSRDKVVMSFTAHTYAHVTFSIIDADSGEPLDVLRNAMFNNELYSKENGMIREDTPLIYTMTISDRFVDFKGYINFNLFHLDKKINPMFMCVYGDPTL
jgi:hypothetical protein